MKLKSLLFAICFSLFSTVFAANLHTHPKADNADKKSITNNLTFPGYCQIEVINNSYSTVNVFGTFDDGSTVNFNVFSFESPHYISLFYYFYCHSGMYITIQSPPYTLYSGWTDVNSTIRIVPFFGATAQKQDNAQPPKVEITTR